MPMLRPRTAKRLLVGTVMLLIGGAATSAAPADTASRARALAKFDAGYAQCEQRVPAMKGRRDQAWANLYRLKQDDALNQQLGALRKSADYKAESGRASKALARDARASDVSRKLELQCQGLQREVQR